MAAVWSSVQRLVRYTPPSSLKGRGGGAPEHVHVDVATGEDVIIFLNALGRSPSAFAHCARRVFESAAMLTCQHAAKLCRVGTSREIHLLAIRDLLAKATLHRPLARFVLSAVFALQWRDLLSPAVWEGPGGLFCDRHATQRAVAVLAKAQSVLVTRTGRWNGVDTAGVFHADAKALFDGLFYPSDLAGLRQPFVRADIESILEELANPIPGLPPPVEVADDLEKYVRLFPTLRTSVLTVALDHAVRTRRADIAACLVAPVERIGVEAILYPAPMTPSDVVFVWRVVMNVTCSTIQEKMTRGMERTCARLATATIRPDDVESGRIILAEGLLGMLATSSVRYAALETFVRRQIRALDEVAFSQACPVPMTAAVFAIVKACRFGTGVGAG